MSRNARTALWLALIASMFFVAIIVKQLLVA
ncbi:cytochrome oxidase small assembly protein [Chitinibacteraceae bacterium HSL-7]